MLESGIQKLVTSASTFTALAGNRFFPVLLPEAAPLPAATYQLITTRPLYVLDERVNFTQARIQIDTWASTYSDAKLLMEAINTSLDDFTGTLTDGTKVLGVQLLTSSDGYESDALIYRCSADYLIQFNS